MKTNLPAISNKRNLDRTLPFIRCIALIVGILTLLPWNTYARVSVDVVRKHAEQGDAKAQYNLGVCYAKGEGVTRDITEAVKWWKAAEQGHKAAQFELGWCYAEGEGVLKDLTEAVKWYQKATTDSVMARLNGGDKLILLYEDMLRESVNFRSMSRFHRLQELFRVERRGKVTKVWDGGELGVEEELRVDPDKARNSTDLYNTWHGKNYVNGKETARDTTLRDEFLRTVHPEIPKEKYNEPDNFYKYAPEFAMWAAPEIRQEAAAYEMRFNVVARELVYQRLRALLAENPNATTAQQVAILDAVYCGKEGPDSQSPYDDAYHAPSVITDDVVREVFIQHGDGYALYGADGGKGLEEAREKLRPYKEAGARIIAEQEAAKEAEKAAKKAAPRTGGQRATAEKEKKIDTETQYITERWKAAQTGFNDADAEISVAKFKELKEKFDMHKGDELWVRMKMGTRTYEYPVTRVYKLEDTDSEEGELILSPTAVRQMKRGRGQPVGIDGEANIKYFVKKKKKK